MIAEGPTSISADNPLHNAEAWNTAGVRMHQDRVIDLEIALARRLLQECPPVERAGRAEQLRELLAKAFGRGLELGAVRAQLRLVCRRGRLDGRGTSLPGPARRANDVVGQAARPRLHPPRTTQSMGRRAPIPWLAGDPAASWSSSSSSRRTAPGSWIGGRRTIASRPRSRWTRSAPYASGPADRYRQRRITDPHSSPWGAIGITLRAVTPLLSERLPWACGPGDGTIEL